MLQLRQHLVVIGMAVYIPVVSTTDLWVQWKAKCCRDGVGTLMEEKVTRDAAHITECRDQVVSQIVFGIEGIVMHAHRRQITRKEVDSYLPSGRKAVRPKRGNRILVLRIGSQ